MRSAKIAAAQPEEGLGEHDRNCYKASSGGCGVRYRSSCRSDAAAGGQRLPAVSLPAATGLGSALGSATCAVPIFNASECAAGAATIGGVFYLGPNDATPPARNDILTLNPIPVFLLIPVVGAPLAGWWSTLDIEVCVGGVSARVGGYGTLTASLGSGC